jgi:membrane-bound metal-dependent hydrolase YbcI (DUF457 family)
MFIGHYGPGYLGKRLSPELPLWALFVAVEFLDVLWCVFVLLGVEKLRIVPGITAANALDLYDMPYTHSLVGALLWSLLAGALWRLFRRNETAWREALVIAAAVFVHWVLDLLVHRPDLGFFGGLKVGFGLWNFPWPEFALETAVLVGGLIAYLGSPAARRSSNRRGAIALVAILLVIELVRVTLRPVPSSGQAVAASSLAVYVVYSLAAVFLDRPAAHWSAISAPTASRTTEGSTS